MTTTWTYTEDSGYRETFEAPDLDAAVAHGAHLLQTGDWANSDRTIWVHAQVTEVLGEDSEDLADGRAVKVQLDPPEPKCSSIEHIWQQESLAGNGGGVIITETCDHCSWRRTINTWAHDPADGEQGLCSIAYEQRMTDLGRLEKP